MMNLVAACKSSWRPSARIVDVDHYRPLFRQTVMGFFGEMKLAAIDSAALRGYAAMLAAKRVQVRAG